MEQTDPERRVGVGRFVKGGLIVITDRKGLEAAPCDCYHVIEDELERLVG